MGGFLTQEQKVILREAHHASLGRKQADRIKTILMLDKGFSYTETAKLLLLDETTIRRYKVEFEKTGIDGLLEDRYHGSDGYLSTEQEKELTIYLKAHTYQTVKAVAVYVFDTYGKQYSIDGMTHLLHRLHFVYKKTKALPGKVNLQKQEQFKAEYEVLKEKKKPEDKIYFLDASHPQHNNMPFYGWIYKGETKVIKTNSGRARINLNGALNLEDMEITVLSEETINRYAMMRLVLTLEEKQPTGEIYLIVDNASYNHSYEFDLFLQDHPRAHLIFLPAYSPNLNIIERLWKFFHEKHRDKYFEKFKEFETAALSFFQNIHQYDSELKTRLTDSFQTLPAF
jgi:transposase